MYSIWPEMSSVFLLVGAGTFNQATAKIRKAKRAMKPMPSLIRIEDFIVEIMLYGGDYLELLFEV